MIGSAEDDSLVSGNLIDATRVEPGSGLDSAFNAGFDGGDYAPNNEFSEFDSVSPISPISPISPSGQTVEVSGSSFEPYTVKKGDNLWSIAKRNKVSLNELYAANGLNENSMLSIDQQIQIPVDGSTATVNTVAPDAYQPTSLNQDSATYTVKSGDSLSKIAKQYGSTVRAIKAANGLPSDLIRVGEKLVIPVSGSTSSTATPSATVSTGSVVSASSSNNSTTGVSTHKVKSGEYPGTIARKYGMTTSELLALNAISDPRKLQVGQVLKVSGFDSVSSSSSNDDSRAEAVVVPAATQDVTAELATTIKTAPASSITDPVEITLIEADPLVEVEATEIQIEDIFEGAAEIPVIRMEE